MRPPGFTLGLSCLTFFPRIFSRLFLYKISFPTLFMLIGIVDAQGGLAEGVTAQGVVAQGGAAREAVAHLSIGIFFIS